MQYSALPRLETNSLIFTAKVICSSSFFSVPLSLIFNYCMPERKSTKAPCPIGHQWDELPQYSDTPCTMPLSHLLFARLFHKAHLPWASPTILHQIVPKSLGARTPTFFSTSALLPCSLTQYPAWIVLSPRPEKQTFLHPHISVLPGSDSSPGAVCGLVPETFILKV